jgi:SAM-dependent methyltransferase
MPAVAATDSNFATYEHRRVVESYANLDELFPAEAATFSRYESQFSGAVLDIAVGAGRTTRALLPTAKRYVGFDYSAGMVRLSRSYFPGADLRELDMRDVRKAFRGQRFDAILISFNAIDLIPWEQRNQVLAALRLMLTPDGVLAFSTHDLAAVNENRGFRIRDDLRPDWQVLRSKPVMGAKKLVKLPFWIAVAFRNYLKHLSRERIYDGFAYVNDSGENYGLLTCYVSTRRQIQMLEQVGYQDVKVLQPWLANEQAAFNYFVCTRGRAH